MDNKCRGIGISKVLVSLKIKQASDEAKLLSGHYRLSCTKQSKLPNYEKMPAPRRMDISAYAHKYRHTNFGDIQNKGGVGENDQVYCL